jgi:hypothetical protein
VLLAYSARNRSASCRIPVVSNPKGKGVEVRFPEAVERIKDGTLASYGYDTQSASLKRVKQASPA